MRTNNREYDDFVILKPNGDPIFHLAVVVDDGTMKISHVIRGDDHLTNAARQIVIYQGMGWTVPEMSHIPLIHGPDGAKLSKMSVGSVTVSSRVPPASTADCTTSLQITASIPPIVQ